MPCSFWLVHALAATRRTAAAHELLTELCGLATPLGLYGEEIDPAASASWQHPQALTGAALAASSP